MVRIFLGTGCGTRARCSSLGRVNGQRSSGKISKLDLGEGCGSSVMVGCGVEGLCVLAGRAGSDGSLIPHFYRERCSSSSVSPKILITLFSDECGLRVYIKHDKHFVIIS